MAQRRADGRCFHCDEKFTPDHKHYCKHLFVIELIGFDYDDAPQETPTDPTSPSLP